jgi:hypothetical protein
MDQTEHAESPFAPPPLARSDDSPFAPPRAVLADGERSLPPVDRPWQVTRALACYWIGWGLTLLNAIWEYTHPTLENYANPGVLLIGNAFIALLMGWIYSVIAKGRNWARIVILVLTGLSFLGLPFFIYGLFILKSQNPLSVVGSAVDYMLFYYAFYLLLTGPAKEWFRSMNERS